MESADIQYLLTSLFSLNKQQGFRSEWVLWKQTSALIAYKNTFCDNNDNTIIKLYHSTQNAENTVKKFTYLQFVKNI